MSNEREPIVSRRQTLQILGIGEMASLYLANQEIWISQWGGDVYQGRGVPGETDEPPA